MLWVLAMAELDATLSRLAAACLHGPGPELVDGEARLASLTLPDLIRLDERARFMTWSRVNVLGPAAPWENLLDRAPTAVVAVVASMHRDGFLRERAVVALASQPGSLASRALAIRAVDHVSEVRERAADALSLRLDVESIPVVFGVLVRLAGRGHGGAALDRYLSAVGGYDDRLLGLLTSADDLLVRRLAYREGLGRGLLIGDDLPRLVATERDQWSRRMLAESWAKVDPGSAMPVLLNGRYVEGRLVALYELPQDNFRSQDLERLMLDPSARVREAARWRYRRSGSNPQAFYRTRWEVAGLDDPKAHRVLQGLRETGMRLSAEEAQAALTDQSAPTRLEALLLWPDPGPSRDLLLRLLLDDARPVQKEAAKQLAALGSTHYDDVAFAAIARSVSQRRAAWLVRRAIGPWDRVRGDLEAMTDSSEELAASARADLLKWLFYRAATVYQVPSPSEKEAIRGLLETADLSPDVKTQLAFHARIPRDPPWLGPEPEPRRPWWKRKRS